MNFEYNNQRYWITFRHDPCTDIAAHEKHAVGIKRIGGTAKVVCFTCCTKTTNEPLPLHPVSRKNKRGTTCTIKVASKVGEKPVTLLSAKSKVNVKAGDRFNKKEGREAALEAALSGTSYDFSVGALQCYDTWGI